MTNIQPLQLSLHQSWTETTKSSLTEGSGNEKMPQKFLVPEFLNHILHLETAGGQQNNVSSPGLFRQKKEAKTDQKGT